MTLIEKTRRCVICKKIKKIKEFENLQVICANCRQIQVIYVNKYESADEQVRTVHNHEVIITRLQLQVQQLHQQLTDLEGIVCDLAEKMDRMTE